MFTSFPQSKNAAMWTLFLTYAPIAFALDHNGVSLSHHGIDRSAAFLEVHASSRKNATELGVETHLAPLPEGTEHRGFFVRKATHPHHSEASLEADVPGIIDEDELEGNHALETTHGIARHLVVPCATVFLMSMTLGHVLTLWKVTSWIPESAATLGIAMILGRILRALAEANANITDEAFVLSASTTLNLVLLPVIIFASGWSLRRADFIYQFNPILIFAVLGTLISTVVIGYSSYWISNYLGLHVVKDLRSNMAFAALISAVDPVATLVTYKSLAVEPLLNIMVFGESTINDAVAVVLFSIINERWESLDQLGAALRIAQLLFGSMIYGVALAGLLVFIMRVTSMAKNKEIAILYIWCSPFLVYASAESSGIFSGIIATLMAGIMFGAYGRLHLKEDAGDEADHFFELTCELADKAVFVLCGASTAMITSTRGYMLGGVSILLCLFGRACSVIPCGLITNYVKQLYGDPHTLSCKHLFMMWHAGLRGGIALVLALEIDAKWCHYKATIVNATFITICFLLLVNGGTTQPLLNALEIPTGCNDAKWDALKPESPGAAQAGIKRLDSSLKQILAGDDKDDEKVTMMTN